MTSVTIALLSVNHAMVQISQTAHTVHLATSCSLSLMNVSLLVILADLLMQLIVIVTYVTHPVSTV